MGSSFYAFVWNLLGDAWSTNKNFLPTEREFRTGRYRPEIVVVRTERSEVRTKTKANKTRVDIPQYGSS